MRMRATVCCLAVGAALAAGWRAGDRPPPADPLPAAEEADREGKVLDAATAAARGRIADRQAVARALVCGGVTLDEAAARFRRLNADAPHLFAAARIDFPAATDEELTYWQVVRYARAEGRNEPGGLARLVAEYRDRFPSGPDPLAAH